METAKQEKYFDVAEQEFEQLKVKIGHELDQDFESFKDELKEMLTDEIVTRYYYQRGAIKSAIQDDKGIEKAKETLKDPNAFSSVFTKGKIISSNLIVQPDNDWVLRPSLELHEA